MRLGELQRWMQAVVVHPGTTGQALRSPAAKQKLAPSKIGQVLLPSPTLSPAERIAVYQEMYPLRMRDALAGDYPALEHFLGERFPDFVAAYTATHPSKGYTLNRLGDFVPAWLARQRRFAPRPFLVDLARLELALTEAFDEQEAPALPLGDLNKIPGNRLQTTRLHCVPSIRLIAVKWNVGAYLESIGDKEHRHPEPRKEDAYFLIFRRKYALYRLAVSAAAYRALEDVVAGLPLGRVVKRSLARRGQFRGEPEDFARWFSQWTSEGIFAGVRKKA